MTKARLISKGKAYIKHIPDSEIARAASNGFEATTDFSRASDADALIICVPTPLDVQREPDLKYVINTMEMLVPYLRKGQVVSLESTTYPGTTDEILKSMIEAAGFEFGTDIFLVYSPGREDPGNTRFSTSTIPKLCGGDTDVCRKVGESLYKNVIDIVVPVSSTKVAEMAKLLVNEMKIVADKMCIDMIFMRKSTRLRPNHLGLCLITQAQVWVGTVYR